MPLPSRFATAAAFAALLSLLLGACATPGRQMEPWSVSDGIDTPESTYFDAASGSVFVSQVGLRSGGSPLDKDGNGAIAKLTADGKVVAAKWVTGLNSPKGLRSHGGTLWVADVDEVVGIDIASGRIATRVPVPGAKALNDVATGADGTVYVSDTLTGKIHSIRDGRVATVSEGEQLEAPNGLLVEGDSLIVAAWGKPEPDFSTKVPGRLYRLNIATGTKTLITPAPLGNLDGVESDGRGQYLVSDWGSGRIYRIARDGTLRTLLQLKKGAADIAYLPASRTLIVPHMLDNRVQAYRLADD